MVLTFSISRAMPELVPCRKNGLANTNLLHIINPAQNFVGFCNPYKLQSTKCQRNQMLVAEGCKLPISYSTLSLNLLLV